MTQPGAGLLQAFGRLRRRIGGGDTREPGAYNHVSLGCHCQMAHLLKARHLRHWSGPFDWIFTMPGMVRDCLADDFAALTDRAQLETIPLAERRGADIWHGRHRLYRERHGLECIFNHHDPAANDADYAFLTEGVRRLRRALDTPDTRNRHWMMTHLHTPPEVVDEVCDLLAARASRNHLTFIQIVPASPAARLVEASAPRTDLRWLTVETVSQPVGLRFTDPADEAFVAATLVAEVAREPAWSPPSTEAPSVAGKPLR